MRLNIRNLVISLVISLVVAFTLAALQVNALMLIILACLAGVVTAKLLPPIQR